MIYERDWSLHRQGPADQARHEARIRKALKENLRAMVAEEAIVLGEGKRRIRVPIRSLEEFYFRFDHKKSPHVGSGGNIGARPGDVLAAPAPAKGQNGAGGQESGEDVYEAEISLEDLESLLFEDLELPYLRPKTEKRQQNPEIAFYDRRRTGLMANLDKRQTLLENLRRHARNGEARIGAFDEQDLRFRTWVEIPKPSTSAVVIAMRDVSGSMGEMKKYLARSFYFWMVRFLRHRYRDVQLVFIAHHTSAREVDEETFFHLGESGGTKVSSAYQLCLDLLRERYPVEQYNSYAFHFSDGDNWGDTDNRLSATIVQAMLPWICAFGYAEIRESGRASSLLQALRAVESPQMTVLTMARKEDVYSALRTFFRARPQEEAGHDAHP